MNRFDFRIRVLRYICEKKAQSTYIWNFYIGHWEWRNSSFCCRKPINLLERLKHRAKIAEEKVSSILQQTPTNITEIFRVRKNLQVIMNKYFFSCACSTAGQCKDKGVAGPWISSQTWLFIFPGRIFLWTEKQKRRTAWIVPCNKVF